MSENSKISWTDHTFNPWWGCAKVSPACDNCYAERDAGRYMPGKVLWGVDAERRTFADKHWNDPVRWNRKAEQLVIRYRVFCASMADVFDKNAPEGARERLWALIKATPHLDWLLLTKRIGNAKDMLPADWGDGYANVWLGITVVNQDEYDRDMPKLLRIPARIRWISAEPLLGPINLSAYLQERAELVAESYYDFTTKVDWVITGGESGPKARAGHPDWYRSLREQCQAAGVPFHFKQWGEWFPVFDRDKDDPDWGKCHGVEMLTPDGRWMNIKGGHGFHGERVIRMDRIGKKKAGRLLDGRTWDEYPT